MSDMNTAPAKSRIPIWFRIVLGLSLALNLAVVGVVAGAAWRHGGKDRMRGPGHPGGAALYRALPPDERRAFRDDLRARHPDLHNPAQNGQDALIAALRARPFDPQALAAAMSAEAARREVWQRAVQQVWLERVTAMDDAARATFADRIEEISLRHPHARREAGGRPRAD